MKLESEPVVAEAVEKVKILPLLRDFQAQWESPALGTFPRSGFFHGPLTHEFCVQRR
jgi:hypothetical protein